MNLARRAVRWLSGRWLLPARPPLALLSHPGLPDCELVHAPGRQHGAPPDQPQRPSLARVSPAAGIPVPAWCGRGEQATLNITQGLEPPGASPSEPGRRSPRHPATTVRVSRRNPRPAQVGRTRGGEHGPGAAERPLSLGGVGRAPAQKRRRRGQQWQGREPNPVLRARQVARPHPTAATRGLSRPAPASSTGAHFPGAAAGRAGVRGPLWSRFVY